MDRKKALISGAASGIGRATAERFAREGWDLCITDRNAPGLLSVFQELPAGDHLHCPGDFTDPLAVARISERIAESWGYLDALVNCAGVFMSADAVESPLEEWRRPLDIMINGAVNLTRACVPKMKQGGRIIHITSIHSQRAEKGSSAYAMAKAAVGQYCRGLAVELAGRGILVNAIAPGFIDTPMGITEGVNIVDTEPFRRDYVQGHHLPLRRAGRPEEVAGVALFLAGEDASYITGQVITVDGGLTVTF
ncbi:SDR family oxidoreductase [Oscillospiraceae bacterium 42-9]